MKYLMSYNFITRTLSGFGNAEVELLEGEELTMKVIRREENRLAHEGRMLNLVAIAFTPLEG
jgi:hypothetical protein